MSTVSPTPPTTRSTLPGAPILLRVRRLLVVGLVTALVYSIVSGGSRTICSGGYSDGGFVDNRGEATELAPLCLQASLQPTPLVLVIGAFVVLATLTRVLRRADSVAAAIRIVARAEIAIVVATIAWLAVTLVAFWTIPFDTWDGTATWYPPFTIGNVVIEITPMNDGITP